MSRKNEQMFIFKSLYNGKVRKTFKTERAWQNYRKMWYGTGWEHLAIKK